MSLYTTDEIEGEEFNASLRLQLQQMTERWKDKNDDNIRRAQERSEIYRQLETFGLHLNPDGKIVKL